MSGWGPRGLGMTSSLSLEKSVRQFHFLGAIFRTFWTIFDTFSLFLAKVSFCRISLFFDFQICHFVESVCFWGYTFGQKRREIRFWPYLVHEVISKIRHLPIINDPLTISLGTLDNITPGWSSRGSKWFNVNVSNLKILLSRPPTSQARADGNQWPQGNTRGLRYVWLPWGIWLPSALDWSREPKPLHFLDTFNRSYLGQSKKGSKMLYFCRLFIKVP